MNPPVEYNPYDTSALGLPPLKVSRLTAMVEIKAVACFLVARW
jgi:hypothetical protein